MWRVDWDRFGANVRAQAVADAAQYKQIEQRLGISHARMINAAQGKPLGTDIFLTLCSWMQINPMWFCDSDGSGEASETRSGSTEGNSAGRRHRQGAVMTLRTHLEKESKK